MYTLFHNNKHYNQHNDPMGNYSNLPKRPPLKFDSNKHQFESTYTPFTDSEIYSIDPPIFTDPVDIQMGELVRPRVATQQFFPPTELIKIIDNVVSGLAELEQNGFKSHGDLSFQTIYYDKNSKLFKITHPVFSPESGYELSKKGKRFSFLSPEQLLCLTDPEQLQQNIVSIKSDLFTLGVIMCEISTLLPSNQIYCPNTYIIFDKEIKNRLQLLKQYYHGEPLIHQKFTRLLYNLLEYDQSKRKSCRQLLSELKQSNIYKPSQQYSVQSMRRLPYAAEPPQGQYIRR